VVCDSFWVVSVKSPVISLEFINETEKLILQVRAKLIQLCETQGILPWNFWEIAAKKRHISLRYACVGCGGRCFGRSGSRKKYFRKICA